MDENWETYQEATVIIPVTYDVGSDHCGITVKSGEERLGQTL